MKKLFIIQNHPEATETPVYFRGTPKSAMILVKELNRKGGKTTLQALKKASEKKAALVALAA